jgi:6-phospho-beta-glucosidase
VSEWAYGPNPIPDMDGYGAEGLMDIILGLENRGFAEASEMYLNVTNAGAVPNLPSDCNLELTCHVTPRGAQPVQVAPLAPYPLGVLMPLVSINALAMKAAVERDRQAFVEALLLDPLLQDFRSVRALADRLWAVNAKWRKPG